jgi:hypothetical protein
MGQKVSFQVGFQEYTPDTKPLKKEIYPSIEKPKKENEDNELNERESAKAMQKKLGIGIIKKHSEMPMKMESFIIDTILVENLKHSGNGNIIPDEIPEAIHNKLKDQYGGHWCVTITKSCLVTESGYSLSPIHGTHIFLTYKNLKFSIFQSFDQKLLQKKNHLSTEKPINEITNEKERESLNAIQRKLGINVLKILEGGEMPMKRESFVIDAILVETLKHSGNCNEISKAIRVKLDDQYGSGWNVLITNPRKTAQGLTIMPGSFIFLEYVFLKYIVFKNR